MSLKRTMRAMIDRAAAATGVLASREREMARSLSVLMYHRVLPDELWKASPLPGLVMPLSAFEAQVAHLAKSFDVVTLDAGRRRASRQEWGTRPLLSVTFDDGYDDNHTHAAPVLERHALHATFFLVSGFVGTDVELWFDSCARWFHGATPGDVDHVVRHSGVAPPWAHADKPPVRLFMNFLKALSPQARSEAMRHMHSRERTTPRRACDLAMSIDDARDLRKRGHEIGTHTVTHPLLPQLDDAQLAAEISMCKQTIETWLAEPVTGFCYPNGDHDDRVVRAVRQAGYAYAPTVLRGRNLPSEDPFRLRRIDMNSAKILRGDSHDQAILRAELALLHKA